jgi:hypothetical protein
MKLTNANVSKYFETRQALVLLVDKYVQENYAQNPDYLPIVNDWYISDNGEELSVIITYQPWSGCKPENLCVTVKNLLAGKSGWKIA